MADQIEILLPKTRFNEQTNFTASIKFRDRSTAAASTPTTVHWRLDNLTTKDTITEWTLLASPAASMTLLIDNTQTKIEGNSNRVERKEITIKADDGLSTQAIGRVIFQVHNIYGIKT